MEEPYDRYTWAKLMFDERRYDLAITHLEGVLEEVEYGFAEARLLLALAYFRTAQLGRAERAARALVDANPGDAYATLLLARTLQRQSRHDEAAPLLTLASVLGAPETSWED